MFCSDEIRSLREQNKRKFKEHLFKRFNSKDFQKEWNQIVKGYTIDILQNKHRLEALNILSYAFSASSKNVLARIFQTSTKRSFEMHEPIIDHVIKTGTGFVVLDKNSYVCYVGYALDVVESNLIKYDTQPHWSYLDITLKNNLKRIHKYQQTDKIKYGEYSDLWGMAKRPDFQKRGFVDLILCFLYYPFFSMGYKMTFGYPSHIVTIRQAMSMKQFPGFYVYEHNFGEFTFEDGSTINDILDDIKRKYDWKNVDEYRNLKIPATVQNYEEIRKEMHSKNISLNQLAMFMLLFLQRKKLKRTKSKL